MICFPKTIEEKTLSLPISNDRQKKKKKKMQKQQIEVSNANGFISIGMQLECQFALGDKSIPIDKSVNSKRVRSLNVLGKYSFSNLINVIIK